MAEVKFKNPQNGYIIKTDSHGAYALLFGGFYFAKHGAWAQAIISFIVALFTAGISWLIYPFFARKIITDNYLRKGWETTT